MVLNEARFQLFTDRLQWDGQGIKRLVKKVTYLCISVQAKFEVRLKSEGITQKNWKPLERNFVIEMIEKMRACVYVEPTQFIPFLAVFKHCIVPHSLYELRPATCKRCISIRNMNFTKHRRKKNDQRFSYRRGEGKCVCVRRYVQRSTYPNL